MQVFLLRINDYFSKKYKNGYGLENIIWEMLRMTMGRLKGALLDGDQSRAVTEVLHLIDAGVESERIVIEAIEEAMEQLGAKCTVEQFNLLEIMLVGRAVTAVMKQLFDTRASSPRRKGSIAVASLEGDVHDLGKNIFKTVLTAKGIHVVDCGRDCPVDRLIDTAKDENARFICISGLITTIIPQVRQVRESCARQGFQHVQIVAGGAALKQSTAENLNVDYVAENAFDGARFIERSLGGAK